MATDLSLATVEAPAAEACGACVKEGESVEPMIRQDAPGVRFSFRTLFQYMGPGWLMSLAYLDPGNLESDLQNGAYAGYSLIWVLLWSTIAGLCLQILAARLGTVTGSHLAEMCRKQYPRPVAMTLWACTELAIIGADVQEVVGSAIAIRELFGLPLWLGSILTGMDTFTFLMIDRCGKRLLELVIFLLIMIMMCCFFLNTIMAPPPLADVLAGLVPQCPGYATVQLVGTVGAVIMPHNIYLHSGLVLSRPVDRGSPEHLRQANKYFAVDSAVALAFSFLINLSLMTTFAHFFFDQSCGASAGGPFACDPGLAPGLAEGGTCTTAQGVSGMCGEIGLQTAGLALERVFRGNGAFARKVFALGVLAAGQSSTMTGTFAGQFVMEGFLEWKIPIWQRTVITRALSLGPAILIAVLTGSSENLNNRVNEWINILQSVQLPFALLPVLSFTSDEAIMGEFVLPHGWRFMCWLLALTVISLNFYLVNEQFAGSSALVWVFVVVFFVAYVSFMLRIVSKDMRRLTRSVRTVFGAGGDDAGKLPSDSSFDIDLSQAEGDAQTATRHLGEAEEAAAP